MTDQTIPAYDDEISFLDLLVTLAESWKLLVFGPLIAGVLAGGVSFMLPKTFESVALVNMTEEDAAYLHVAPVLDSLIEEFGLLAESGGDVEGARKGVKARLTFAVDKKTKLVTITAKGRTPDSAQALGSSAIAAVLNERQVKGKQKAMIEKTIAINSRAIDNAQDAMDSIQRVLSKSVLGDQQQESAIKNLALINSDIAKRSQENEELRQKLEPIGEDVFVQKPSLPKREVSSKHSLVALFAILVSCFALLIFVFIRETWKSAAQDKQSAQKIASIKKAFQIK